MLRINLISMSLISSIFSGNKLRERKVLTYTLNKSSFKETFPRILFIIIMSGISINSVTEI